jgi:hypothetical protein
MTESLYPKHGCGPVPETTPPESLPEAWARFAAACWECGRERKSPHDGGNEWFCAHCREAYP